MQSFSQTLCSLLVSKPHAHKLLDMCGRKAWPGLLVCNMDEGCRLLILHLVPGIPHDWEPPSDFWMCLLYSLEPSAAAGWPLLALTGFSFFQPQTCCPLSAFLPLEESCVGCPFPGRLAGELDLGCVATLLLDAGFLLTCAVVWSEHGPETAPCSALLLVMVS